MTQIKKNTEFQGPEIKPAGGLSDSQTKGLAQRKDIVELHNRLAAMLNGLNRDQGRDGPEKAEKDRALLLARLDQVEKAVNKMEGALRIELEPMLRDLLAEAVEDRTAPKGRPVFRTIAIAGIFIAGLAAGSLYPDKIKTASASAIFQINEIYSGVIANLPLNGGSQKQQNQTE